MATRYERLVEVVEPDMNGIEVTLALQRRFSPGLAPWVTVSWRTRLRPGGPNRRFYMLNRLPWSVSIHLAADLFDELERRGGLDKRFHDHVRRPTFEMRTSESARAAPTHCTLDDITYPGEHWGERVAWVVLEGVRPVQGHRWRKILIADPETGRATFRSTTTSPTYRPRAVLRPGSDWVLDNSMQDTTVQEALVLRRELRDLLASGAVPHWDGTYPDASP